MPRVKKTEKKLLTKERIAELRNEIATGAASVAELAKKYGISEAGVLYHQRVANGRPRAKVKVKASAEKSGEYITAVDLSAETDDEPADFSEEVLASLNADILSGEFTEDQLRKKYKINSRTKYFYMRRKAEQQAAKPLTQDQVEKIVRIVGNIARLHPRVFADLDIVGRVARKYPTILMDII